MVYKEKLTTFRGKTCYAETSFSSTGEKYCTKTYEYNESGKLIWEYDKYTDEGFKAKKYKTKYDSTGKRIGVYSYDGCSSPRSLEQLK